MKNEEKRWANEDVMAHGMDLVRAELVNKDRKTLAIMMKRFRRTFFGTIKSDTKKRG
jgi:hypothetical protein